MAQSEFISKIKFVNNQQTNQNQLLKALIHVNMEEICSKVNFCQICPLQFENKLVYDLHMSLLHKNLNTIEQSFNNEESLEQENNFCTQHIKEEMDISIEDNILQIPNNTTLANKIEIKSPIPCMRRGPKTYKCPVCNEIFSNKGSLKQHIDSVHEEKKPHKCSICDYSCYKKGYLKKHVESVHENKKSHRCPICDHSCSQKSNLKKHMESVHKNKKPH